MIREVALPIALAVIAGCVSPSPCVSCAATPATATAATTPASGPGAAPDATLPATSQASATVAAIDGPPAGWQQKDRVGETVYCRKVKITGTRYPQEVCLRPEEVGAALRAEQKMQAQRTRPMSESIEVQN